MESDISPNQRLLALIRESARTDRPGGPPPPVSGKASRKGFPGRPATVGVDISQSRLVCAKVRGNDAGFELDRVSTVPIPEGVEPGGEAFAALLRDTLRELCGSGRPPRIWAAVQNARANLQFVTIPKVASRQVDNAVFWTAKKEMGFDEAAVVFDFERRGEVAEKGVSRLGALACTAPREIVGAVRSAFAAAGFPLDGLTLEAFGHQNLFRRRLASQGAGGVANLHVDQNWSRLEIFNNGDLMFMRVIKTSMAGMEQAVLEALESRAASGRAAFAEQPAGPAGETVLDLDDMGAGEMPLFLELDTEPPASQEPPAPPRRETVTPEAARDLFQSIFNGREAVGEGHPGFGLGPAEVMAILEPVMSRLVRQVEMTLKHYRESLGYEAVGRVTVSGELGASQLFLGFVGAHLGLPCAALDPLAGRLSGVPEGAGAACSQALGLALSDPSVTPNLLCTYREKAVLRDSGRFERWALAGLAAVLAAMAVFSFGAVSTRHALSHEHEALAAQLAGSGADLDPAALEKMADGLSAKRGEIRRFAGRNRIVGLWGEALALAPEGVGIGTMTVDLGPPDRPAEAAPPAGGGQPAKPAAAPPVSRFVVEGMVTGDQRLFEALLASYVVALEGSPLFENVSVKKSEALGREGGGPGLHFVLALGLTEN